MPKFRLLPVRLDPCTWALAKLPLTIYKSLAIHSTLCCVLRLKSTGARVGSYRNGLYSSNLVLSQSHSAVPLLDSDSQKLPGSCFLSHLTQWLLIHIRVMTEHL